MMSDTCIGCTELRWHSVSGYPACRALGYVGLDTQWAGDVPEGELEWVPVQHEKCPRPEKVGGEHEQ
jgi:hypothetical protein